MECINCKAEESNKSSGLCNNCEGTEEKQINGLLYVPAAGLILTFFFSLYSLYDVINAVLIHYQISGIITWYAIGVILFLGVSFLLSSFTMWMFFRRKKGTQVTMVVYYLFNAAMSFYFNALPVIAFGMPLDDSSIRGLAIAATGLVFWLPYFILSKRINVVFHK